MGASKRFERFADGWVLRVNGVWIHGYHFGLNDAAAAAICDDKAATSEVLGKTKLPVVPHWFLSREQMPDVSGLLTEYGALVVKPNEGTGGRDVLRVSSEIELSLALERLLADYERLSVSPYVEVETEFRVIVLRGEPVLIYAKKQPAEGWLFNLGQGAVPEVLYSGASGRGISSGQVAKLAEIAVSACARLGLLFASVDLVLSREQHELLILEVNSGVMLEHFSRLSDGNYALAKTVYQLALGL